MDDIDIINLYWERNEKAIDETSIKYGRLLYSISFNILSNNEDSQECVNETYMKAWKSMPPEKPRSLLAYIGRIVRNLSFDCWNKNRAQKRYSGGELLLSELEECIPSSDSIWSEIDSKFLSKLISKWLCSLSEKDRNLFIRRYWYGDSIKELAIKTGTSPNKLAGHMYRLRLKLRDVLEVEEVYYG